MAEGGIGPEDLDNKLTEKDLSMQSNLKNIDAQALKDEIYSKFDNQKEDPKIKNLLKPVEPTPDTPDSGAAAAAMPYPELRQEAVHQVVNTIPNTQQRQR